MVAEVLYLFVLGVTALAAAYAIGRCFLYEREADKADRGSVKPGRRR